MTIQLLTNDNQKILEISEVNISNCSLQIHVYSNGFSADFKFYFDELEHIENFIKDLKTMNEGKIKKTTLKANYEYDYWEFENDKLGHLFVKGEFFDHSGGQHLKFQFKTDRTCLAPFIKGLEVAIKKN